jgi:hypothetical protein
LIKRHASAGYGKSVQCLAVDLTAGMISEYGLILRIRLSIRNCRRFLNGKKRRGEGLNESYN